MKLAGRSALITGAGRGIGRATALLFAREGAAVALAARSRDELNDTAREITAEGGRAFAVPADVSDAAQVQSLVTAAAAVYGPCDLLVNNAGVVHSSPVATHTEADWRRVLDVNLTGAFLCARAVLPGMLERRRGRIINVSSISGTLGTPNLSAYCASKWGLLGFTAALAAEVRERGVQVTAVCPGSTDTRMLREAGHGFEPQMSPEDIARTILFLAADAPDALTGTHVDVFG